MALAPASLAGLDPTIGVPPNTMNVDSAKPIAQDWRFTEVTPKTKWAPADARAHFLTAFAPD
jgi:hypothetical protein